ncbi:unnamed protein product [Musa acuminata subsp. malaccensis]|uniref:(wild Malaysian banana) hypothetical protein n=1 Tax=Musa acuminata subsp. malaccensis TaxID=214687 RepID=A0A804L2I1_MUSAM|nr:unnamed protein product [Musa acuminata subsp. malaccensis]
MKVEQVLHMVGGAGETSNALNYEFQEKSLFIMTKPMPEDAIEGVYELLLPERTVVADLGCSSGPNTFAGGLRGARRRQWHVGRHGASGATGDPVKEQKGDMLVPYYVVGLPGSFYGRRFPCRSVHLFHSSPTILKCQVLRGLETEQGASLNERNIYLAETSPPEVIETCQHF